MSRPIQMTPGQTIRNTRLRMGLTIRALAKRLGTKFNTLKRMENDVPLQPKGNRWPNRTRREKIRLWAIENCPSEPVPAPTRQFARERRKFAKKLAQTKKEKKNGRTQSRRSPLGS